jgi:hypothetical protein
MFTSDNKSTKISYTFTEDEVLGTTRGKGGLLMMAFTCTKCDTKQARTFSKDSYQNGVVLVRCGGCNNLHLVADNLGWFRDGKTNIEDLMKEKGSSVTTNVNSETMEFQLNQTAQPPKTQPVEI